LHNVHFCIIAVDKKTNTALGAPLVRGAIAHRMGRKHWKSARGKLPL